MLRRFRHRADAGQQLAKELSPVFKKSDTIVLALPRGGVPVAFEIAQHLHVLLDLILVRKLGVPGNEDLAFGALAYPNISLFNQAIIDGVGITKEQIDRVVAVESAELDRRNKLYRKGRTAPILEDKIVIIVDDGMATGLDICAAATAVRQQNPQRLIVSVPYSSKDALQRVHKCADEMICLQSTAQFQAVSDAYFDFSQTDDEEVLFLLEEANQFHSNPAINCR